jgi:hypothetical protein
MDEAFSYRTTERQPRFDPRAIKVAILAGLILLAVVSFAVWVSGSEDASFARLRAERTTDTQATQDPGQAQIPEVAENARTQEAALAALGVAQEAVAAGVSYADAGPARLSAFNSRFTFVDGPSTEPEVISVATTASVWAAAIMSPSGACYLVRLGEGGLVTYGTGLDCTGEAALSASGLSWWNQSRTR